MALVLAAAAAVGHPHLLPWQSQEGLAQAQSQDDSPRETPQVSALTQPTADSMTVIWLPADNTAVHWIYAVKADGTGGRFQAALPDPPPSRAASGQSGPVTGISSVTTVTGLDEGTQYWFAILGVRPPSDGSPSQWFRWSNWASGTTLTVATVFLGPGVSVAEGATANVVVNAAPAPESALTVNYAIGVDVDQATADGDSTDFAGNSTGSIVIEAGATSGTIAVVINDDSDIDDGTMETLVVTVSLPEGSGYKLGANASATVTITEGVCDRTAEVRSVILGALPGISDCALVSDADLGAITGLLDLSSNSLAALQARDFRGLTGLQQLRLNHNALAELPEDVFDGLTSLQELYVNNNTLAAVPEDVFDGLSSLATLSLSNNVLTALPSDVFDGLHNLTTLRLNNNTTLAALPADVFDGLTSLTTLRLNNDALAALPDNLFEGLTGLRGLFLANNPGSSFTFTAALEQTAPTQVQVRVAQAAPFPMTVSLSVAGGALSGNSVVVPAGSSASPAITLTPGGDEPVTVSISAVSFPASGVETNGVTVKYNGLQPGLGTTTQAPTANAGPDQTVATGAAVTLDASGSSDPDPADTMSYIWKQTSGATVTLSDSAASGPTFAAPSAAAMLIFQVTVLDGRGGSDRDAVTIAVGARPAPPANLSVTPGDGHLTLSWDDPSDPGIAGYIVQYRESGTDTWLDWTHTDTSQTATITSLANGQSYEVQVRAQNRFGESDWSPSLTATPAANPSIPGIPTLTSRTQTSVTIEWSAPADNGDAITDYDIQYRQTTAIPWLTWDHTGTGRTATITGLTNGQSYEVQVRAKNTVGESDWSPSLTAIPAANPSPPGSRL